MFKPELTRESGRVDLSLSYVTGSRAAAGKRFELRVRQHFFDELL